MTVTRWALLCLALGCAPAVPPAYALAAAAAERAYVHGRYLEAAQRWQDAARVAEGDADRNEALYRRAASFTRARRLADAKVALRAIAASHSERAPRALLDLGEIAFDEGRHDEGWSRLDELCRRYPESGVASRALELRVKDLRNQGEPALRAHLDGLDRAAGRTSLGERIGYERARSFEREGRLAEAAASYGSVARRFPYPEGALWDDAVLAGAKLEARLGRPQRAVQQLENMLAQRETSSFQGSYERPRYAEARFTIAELYRDALGDLERARREFLRVWSSRTTSRLRDDAKWEAGRVAASMKRNDLACADARELRDRLPESRYAACAPLLCAELGPTSDACHAYIRRQATIDDDP